MAATNPDDTGLDHPTVVPTDYVPETTAETDEETPRCPACGRPLDDH